MLQHCTSYMYRCTGEGVYQTIWRLISEDLYSHMNLCENLSSRTFWVSIFGHLRVHSGAVTSVRIGSHTLLSSGFLRLMRMLRKHLAVSHLHTRTRPHGIFLNKVCRGEGFFTPNSSLSLALFLESTETSEVCWMAVL